MAIPCSWGWDHSLQDGKTKMAFPESPEEWDNGLGIPAPGNGITPCRMANTSGLSRERQVGWESWDEHPEGDIWE